MEFINLTPHPITIEGVGTLPPSGVIARCSTLRTPAPEVGGIRVTTQDLGDVTGIPSPEEGKGYIVSGMVLQALNRARGDVFAPDTGADAVRDEKGHIVAVRGLVR